MASPARTVRNVERDYIDPRPRDRAIREAANDNRRLYAVQSDIRQQDPAHPTVDQQFAQSYDQQGLQPSVGRVVPPTRNVTVMREKSHRAVGGGVRAAGATMQTAGLAAQAGGKGLRAAGAGTMRAGAALSSTGLGAIAGVPLIAAGAVMQGTGVGLNAAGKVSTRAGRGTKQLGRKLRGRKGKFQALEVVSKIETKVKVTRVNVMIISAGSSVWMTIQLPASIIATIFLGVAYMVGYFQSTIKGVVGETVYSWGEYLFGGVISTVGNILGFDLLSIINPGTFFALAHSVAFIIGLGTLIGAAITYQISFINCLGGEASAKKLVAFIAAFCFYMLPVINFLPWALIWMFVVWKHPE